MAPRDGVGGRVPRKVLALEQKWPSFTWLNPTRVIFGAGALSNLASVVDEVAGTRGRVFLVTGRRSLRAGGNLQRVVDSIGSARVTLFDKVTPFPSPDLVDSALDVCRSASASIVVAVGGGSAMDLGKSVAILMTHDGASRDYGSGRKSFLSPGLPFVALPTTSGSSSEVTLGAALWDFEAKRSMALRSRLMFPKVAIVDPELAMSMPRSVAAVTGMDPFTSSFESYWSLESQPIADVLNLEVIRLFAANLERSCIQGDLESRSACSLAATISGIACSNTSPNVCHAIGSPLTVFWGTDHGQAVGLTLATFLRWNAPAISPKLPALWDALGVRDLDEATDRITQMMERCGLETRLRGLGVGDGEIDMLVEHIGWDRTRMLPRPLEREDARRLLYELL